MKIQIESSTSCNAKCKFCPRYEMHRPMGEMSDKLFYKIVQEGKELGITRFYPYLNGEFFIFSRAWEWLDYLEKEGCIVSLYTNAELMDVDRLIKYKNIHFVNCSLNAATSETHKKIMRGPDFTKSKENAKKLIEKANFKVRVSMVVSEDNKHEVEDFKKEWGKYATISGMANWVGARPVKQENKKVRRYCNRTIRSITVLWDGRVCMCCLDFDGEHIFGDLNKESLSEIVENMKPIREAHKKHDYSMPPCNKCNYNTL